MMLSLLSTALALASRGEAQLLPAGSFRARDGRPGEDRWWTLDDASGRELSAKVNAVASHTPIVIDYEHQTMLAEKNGQPAPAAGWIKSTAWRAGKGLFAVVEWTDRAKALIEAGEYRFISPVIVFDKRDRITGLINAALVNFPALLGMAPVLAQLAGYRNFEGVDEMEHLQEDKTAEARDLASRAVAHQRAEALRGRYVTIAQAVAQIMRPVDPGHPIGLARRAQDLMATELLHGRVMTCVQAVAACSGSNGLGATAAR